MTINNAVLAFWIQHGSNLDKVTGLSGHKETTAIYTHAQREPAHTQGEHADSVGHPEMIMGRGATLVFHNSIFLFVCLFLPLKTNFNQTDERHK